ncbi:hypothetical protein WKW50_18725 [Ochrobactrum sp. GPK 3]|uniref:hypothetical protein n=1 Tax=Brucella sp. 22210 TaxID=3453892 RepID=UPI003138588A
MKVILPIKKEGGELPPNLHPAFFNELQQIFDYFFFANPEQSSLLSGAVSVEERPFNTSSNATADLLALLLVVCILLLPIFRICLNMKADYY